jgi:bifunctional DNA-binding transcriptional regulator/antitoxin component of YhaV-PrlF toxin-antitoxin module
VIRELKWNKGDVVRMVVDEKKAEILIKKAAISVKTKPEKTSSAKIEKPKTAKKSRW